MVELPDRLSSLIELLEKGQPVTQAELNRLATLQAIDVARMGEQFARQAIDADSKQAELLRTT